MQAFPPSRFGQLIDEWVDYLFQKLRPPHRQPPRPRVIRNNLPNAKDKARKK